ncbi:hypothetical protein XENOCAPTIV_030137 [Xenoophorus captivus]|uniref:MI domain-containing protein n=1 Tax=Xenoophorus captivus TaxID=1517983 RepID=A0ABV0SCB2_9TELE
MRSLMNNKELPARIRFLLQDTVELRENNWVPRKAFIDNGPKTINQIRQDAVKVCHETGTLPLWDAIAPTHSSMVIAATSRLLSSRSLTWGPSLLLSPASVLCETQQMVRMNLLSSSTLCKKHNQSSCHGLRTNSSSFDVLSSSPQEAIMAEYLNTKNLTEAVNGVRELKAPRHFLPEMLSKIIVCSLDRPDEDKEHASTLIHTLRLEGLITGENFMQAFLNVLDQCQKIELDVPLVKSYLAQFAARAIIAELVSVAELAHPLENGTHFPLFLLCLQQTAKLKDREWLMELFQQSKVNMQKMLPGTELLSLSFTMDCFNVEHN